MKAIEIEKLTKYYGKSPGIIDLNFNVEQGEIFGFIGPNGAGKSTTIRTLLNLMFPTSGSAKIFGLDIVKNSKEIKKTTGYLPAESNYYHKMSVNDLMNYSASFYGLKDFSTRLNYLSESLDMDLDKKIRDLSSGNKKKVSIIQSLLHQPKLLILDEPTSGLDPLVQSAFYDILEHDNQNGMTIFFSSHVLSEVQRICHKVAIIRHGKIVKVESIENLKKNMLKKVDITLTGKKYDFSKLQGIVNYKSSNKHISFMFDGEINNLVNHLSNISLDNLSIEEPSLDEVFMHFYKNNGGLHDN